MSHPRATSFDGWVLRIDLGELAKDGRKIRLQDQPLQILDELLSRPGELVTREQLIARLWPTGVVDFDTGLNSAVRKLRVALQDEAETPRYIETVPRRGYRFIGAIDSLAVPPGEPAVVASTASSGASSATVGQLSPDPQSRRLHTAHSIAVLPFVNMSGDPQQEYFCDGMAEELLNSLVRISELKVAARTSAFAFKGKDMEVGDIARRLNVGAILEGSVRKAGERVRITVQLVDAANGYQLWSETYDRELADIFEVQADIAGSVVRQLQATLLGSALPRHTPSSEAYAAYLQGNHFFERGLSVDKAIFYYAQALQLDEYYAAAMVGLAQARFGYGFGVRVDTDVAEARQLIERAIALEPHLVEAYVVRARIARIYDFDWAAAETSMKRARELEPGKVVVLFGMGILAGTLGRLDESVALFRQALERDPLNPGVHIELGLVLLAVGKPEAAEASFRKYLELSPAGHSAHGLIAKALLLRGEFEKAFAETELESHRMVRLHSLALVQHALHRKAESDAALRELTEKYAREAAFGIAEIYLYRHEADQAMRWLEQAYRDHDGGLTRLLSNPLWRTLAHDPRYQAFLRKLNLPTCAG
jgi:TolB-like protein/Tfp pilus assembly protein PilF